MQKSPNEFHPEKPSAIGSRNSLAQEHRDQQAELNQVLEEEVNNVIHHLTAKLPGEALERLDIMGGLKDKLYNYFNQNFQNMFNRYITTAEDEMAKKIRHFIDTEESYVLAHYSPREIARLLDTVGGVEMFNTGEIEKSMVNIYGQLQGHIRRSINELENHTNSLLRQKTDTGAFIQGDLAYSVIKCSFKDNNDKPKTVTDLKLSINILDSELISPIFHYQTTVGYLVKDLLSKYIVDTIDREIDGLGIEIDNQILEEPEGTEILFSKLGKVEKFAIDDKEKTRARRYKILSKAIMDQLSEIKAELEPENFDPMSIRENIKKIIGIENIRNRGFNTAVNSITSILDSSRMAYQYIENLKNAREVHIREYEESEAANLPDERYEIKLKYIDKDQLMEERKAYDLQIKGFQTEVQHVRDIIHVIYEDSKTLGKVTDFNDLAEKVKNKVNAQKLITGEPAYGDIIKVWDEIDFVKAAETEVERSNRTYIYEKDNIRKMIIQMRDILKKIYHNRNPLERRVIENRLDFLEREYFSFDYMINPYHIEPGLVLDIDISSIKRKKATLDSMARVLTEFFHGVSKGFQDGLTPPSFSGNLQNAESH